MEHGGRRWRAGRPLGFDAVLLRDGDGQVGSADSARVAFPELPCSTDAVPRSTNELYCGEVEWQETIRRLGLLQQLAVTRTSPARGNIPLPRNTPDSTPSGEVGSLCGCVPDFQLPGASPLP